MKPSLQLILFVLAINIPSIGIAQSLTKDFEKFDALVVNGNIELVLIPDSENYAEIKLQNTEMDKMDIELSGSKLKFKLKNRGFWGLFGSRNAKARIKLHYTEDLIKISSSAAADISSNDRFNSADNLSLSSSSGSNINLEIACEEIKVGVSSGAEIILEGSVDSQKISVSSGGTYKALEVNSQKAKVSASSGGFIAIWVNEKLEGKASSGASVHYHGNPRITDVSSSSGGSVKSK